MKKTTKPATKTVAKAVAKPAEAAAEKPVAKKAAAPKPAAEKPAAKKASATEILANIDVGFGNTLYIRGEGPGLSWEGGQPMECLKDDIWGFKIAAAAKPIVFKFLINDETWCAGDDYVVEPGQKLTLVPSF